MKIEIYYCAAWEFKEIAAGLAQELHRKFHVTPQLVPGDNGIFDVIIDGECVFSRAETGRFPRPGEIVVKRGVWRRWFVNSMSNAL